MWRLPHLSGLPHLPGLPYLSPCKQALRVACIMRSARRAGRVRRIKQVQTIAPWTWSLDYVFSRRNVLTDQSPDFANVIDDVHKIGTNLSTFQWKADSCSLSTNGPISCTARKVNANWKSRVQKLALMLGHLHSTKKCTRIRSRENLAMAGSTYSQNARHHSIGTEVNVPYMFISEIRSSWRGIHLYTNPSAFLFALVWLLSTNNAWHRLLMACLSRCCGTHALPVPAY